MVVSKRDGSSQNAVSFLPFEGFAVPFCRLYDFRLKSFKRQKVTANPSNGKKGTAFYEEPSLHGTA